ncbi:MAG: helix-turn-helix domain-containing protein [Lentisphaeria bacterium]|nr:helix-turn-helix domain-containing protein [Lentisphaeria bacterium]
MLLDKLITNYAATEKFPLSIHSQYPQVPTPIHRHDFVELCFVASGSGLHVCGDHRTTVSRGDVYVIPRGSFHEYRECSPDFDVINILYIPELVPMPRLDITRLPGWEAFYLCKGDDSPRFKLAEEDFSPVLALVRELEEENRTRYPGHLFNMLGIFMHLLGKLVRLYSRNAGKAASYSPGTADAIAYLNRNFAAKVSIEKLCSVACMSKAALMRNFFRNTGTTPRQYQLNLRIAEAAVLLRSGTDTLEEIAIRTGFSDTNYFGRQFKRITGLSPAAYRKQFRTPPCSR